MMTSMLMPLLLFYILLTVSYNYGFELLIFIAYLPLFYLYQSYDPLLCSVGNRKSELKKMFLVIFILSYIHFVISFWWLRHISYAAPVFMAILLAFFRAIAIFLPFLASLRMRQIRLPFYVSAGYIIEKFFIYLIYPQPYMSANQIFGKFSQIFKPVLLSYNIFQDIFLIMLSYSIYICLKMLINELIHRLTYWRVNKLNKEDSEKWLLISRLDVLFLVFNLIIFGGLTTNYFLMQNIRPLHNCTKELQVAILQPDIKQEIKNEYKNLPNAIMDKILNQIKQVTTMSQSSNHNRKDRQPYKVDLIIGPETIFPFVVQYNNDAYRYLRKLRKKVRTDLLLGGFWEDDKGNIYNAAFLITKVGFQVYRKVQLVIFGEYLPLGSIRFIRKIYDTFLPTQNFEELKNVKKMRVFNYRGLKIQPLICFEGFLAKSYKERANIDLYVNLSNEGWYKDGQELFWAWNITKAFSIFTFTPIIRATNTGISGIHFPDKKSVILEKNGQIINFDNVLIQKVCIYKSNNTALEKIICIAIMTFVSFIFFYVLLGFTIIGVLVVLFFIRKFILKK